MAEGAEGKPDFNGSWKLVKSENFEEFLGANGVNWLMRKMASKSSPKVDITHDGDSFVIKTAMVIRTQEDSFTVGVPFTSEGFGGVKSKVTPSWEGNALVLLNEPAEDDWKGKKVTVKREIIDGQLFLTLCIDDIVCKRWFDKV